MPCSVIKLPGGGVAIVKHSRSPRKRCQFCPPAYPNFATLECDYPTPTLLDKNATCDAKMCPSCATPVGEDKDHCPNHSGRK